MAAGSAALGSRVAAGHGIGTELARNCTPFRALSSQALRQWGALDRTTLERLLNDGLSLAEIGRRLETHPSTVGYWVEKHGLEAVNGKKHLARGRIPKEELEALVDARASVAQIAETLGRSKGTVRHWLSRYELRTAGKRGAREAEDAGLSRAILLCPCHGTSEHVREPRGYFRCCRCRQEAVVRRRRKVKEILVREAGGLCTLCGYDRCLAALQFHHLDPAIKQFGVAQKGAARSIARVRAEVRKCVLLCSNCHAEVEHGAASVSRSSPNEAIWGSSMAEQDPVKVKVVGSSPTPRASFRPAQRTHPTARGNVT